MFGNEKMDQVHSITYLVGIIRKEGGCTEDAKSRLGVELGTFLQ